MPDVKQLWLILDIGLLDCSINEKGLYDYLLINDDLEEAAKRLRAIADRAARGLDPEPGMVPERVVLEDVRCMAEGIPAHWCGPSVCVGSLTHSPLLEVQPLN